MLSDDYLVRMIRQAAAVFARIIGLKQTGDYQEALEEIHHNLEQLLGLNARIMKMLDEESLHSCLLENGQYNLEKSRIIADLFKEEGEIYKLQGNLPESTYAYGKSLSIYLIIDGHNDPMHPIEVSSIMDEIIKNIAIPELNGRTLFDLFCYFENHGKYSNAEKILNLLADRPESRMDAMRELKLFYERLLEKDLMELTSQGLNLKIIQTKLKELT